MARPQAREQDIQQAIIDLLLYRGFLVLRINQGAHIQPAKDNQRRRYIRFARWQELGADERDAGISDILALAPDGGLFAIECKTPRRRGKVSAAQAAFLSAVNAHGGIGIVAWDVVQVEALLREKGY